MDPNITNAFLKLHSEIVDLKTERDQLKAEAEAHQWANLPYQLRNDRMENNIKALKEDHAQEVAKYQEDIKTLKRLMCGFKPKCPFDYSLQVAVREGRFPFPRL